jgi:hypothetical protein
MKCHVSCFVLILGIFVDYWIYNAALYQGFASFLFEILSTVLCTVCMKRYLFMLSVYKVTKHVGEYQTFEVIYTAAHVRRRCRPRPVQRITGWQDRNATATVRQCVRHEVHCRLSVTANWSLEMRTGKRPWLIRRHRERGHSGGDATADATDRQ